MAGLAPERAQADARQAAVRQIAAQLEQQRAQGGPGASTWGAESATSYDPTNDPAFQVGGAIGAFARGLYDLKTGADGNMDKYHHCMANCQATRYGSAGEWSAELLSAGKEVIYDQWIKQRDPFDSVLDNTANWRGRSLAKQNPERSCSELCAHFKPGTWK